MTQKSPTPNCLFGGIFATAFTPFDGAGAVQYDLVSEQAKRFAAIEGVLGVSINMKQCGHGSLSADECLEVIRRTRASLTGEQFVLVCVGWLLDANIEHVQVWKIAGADIVISSRNKRCGHEKEATAQSFADTADKLALPVIFGTNGAGMKSSKRFGGITALAKRSRNIIGFELGGDEDVLQYDQDYYAIKSLDRPVACLPSSEGALFHNLNTGGDGVLSVLASIAPHEVSALYQASRGGCFSEAQAIHNRLAPLVALMHGHDPETRELLYREAAFHRGILGSPHARGLITQLSPELRNRLHKTISDIGLKPVA